MNQRTLGPGRARDARRPVSASARRATAAPPRRSPAVLRARHQRRSLVFVIAAVVAVVAVVGVFGALRSGPPSRRSRPGSSRSPSPSSATAPTRPRRTATSSAPIGSRARAAATASPPRSGAPTSPPGCGRRRAPMSRTSSSTATQLLLGQLLRVGRRPREWHPVGSHYQPKAGDVAVYGLDAGPSPPSMWPWWVSTTPGHAARTWSTATATALASRSSKAGRTSYAPTCTALAQLSGYVSPTPAA